MGESDIRFERRGALVVVTLVRPRALNALTLDMCHALARGLHDWAADPEVGAVLVKGEGERAFCAGGDIRWIYQVLTERSVAEAVAFYAVEYPMNARLRAFPKPYIALLDGITMGGGVGISVHGSHRVVTERTLFAMPETGIGLFPDVGGTYVLPRLPGALGMYLGLTGAKIGAADCLHAGLGSAYVPSERLVALEDDLAAGDLSGDAWAAVGSVLAGHASPPGGGELPGLRDRIDACFGEEELQGVLSALEREPSGWGRRQLEILATKSPTSLAVTSRQLRQGATLDFPAAMRLEYRLVHRFMSGHDFREGVRALIVDKDNRPQWRPPDLEHLDDAEVARYFDPLPDGDLRLDPGDGAEAPQ